MLQNPKLGSRQQEQQGHNKGVILSRSDVDSWLRERAEASTVR